MTKQISQLQHIAIIMDGNRRWAKEKNLNSANGHQAGVQALLKLTKTALKNNLSYLTLYTFSTENWQRSKEEVNALMDIFISSVDKFSTQIFKQNTLIKFIGNQQNLSQKIIQKINHLEQFQNIQAKLQINIAFNYGGRDEIIHATKKISENILNKKITLNDIDENLFQQNLFTKDIPDPDLLIRTGGKKRISNFLLWQLSYTELYFTKILWPDFSPTHLNNAIKQFQQRQRSFGEN